MASTIPAARANLYALLQDQFASQTTQVVFGWPDELQDREVVAVLGVETIRTEEGSIGADRQEERYSIRVRIRLWKPGANLDDAPDVDERAWEIYESIRSTVQSDKTLDRALTSGWANVDVGEAEDSPVPVQDGLQHAVNLLVQCQAVIT